MYFSKDKIYTFEGNENKGKVQFEHFSPLEGNFAIWMNGALCGLAESKGGIKKKWEKMQKKYGLKITGQEANKKSE